MVAGDPNKFKFVPIPGNGFDLKITTPNPCGYDIRLQFRAKSVFNVNLEETHCRL